MFICMTKWESESVLLVSGKILCDKIEADGTSLFSS